MVSVMVTLTPDVVAIIDKKVEKEGGGPPNPASGRYGGRTHFIRKVVHNALGLAEPEDPHAFHLDTTKVDMGSLSEAQKKIVELHRKGLSCSSIASELDASGIPTRRGGKWRPYTVQTMLSRIVAESVNRPTPEPEAPKPTAKAKVKQKLQKR